MELKKCRCSSMSEWEEFYKQKTGEEYRRNKGFTEFYLPNRGICQLSVQKKMVMIQTVSGDGRFWRDVAEIIANITGKKMLGALDVRDNPVAYMRLFGYKLEKTEENPDGAKKYYGVNEQGGKILLSPAYKYYRDGEEQQAYIVTWEVMKNVINPRDNEKDQSQDT